VVADQSGRFLPVAGPLEELKSGLMATRVFENGSGLVSDTLKGLVRKSVLSPGYEEFSEKGMVLK
jgi:hypothetical protein